MVELVPMYQWPRFDFRFIATGFVLASLICPAPLSVLRRNHLCTMQIDFGRKQQQQNKRQTNGCGTMGGEELG